MARLKGLRAEIKLSIDDTKDYSGFNLKVYNSNFIKNKESKNCIPAIMSAMVFQIAKGDQVFHSIETHEDLSTEPEFIDDLFDDLEKEINYDLQISERPPREDH